MADVRLGGAYIEVHADLKKANEQISAWGSKSAPVQKNIIANQNQQTAAIKKTTEATSEHVQKMRELLEVSQKTAVISARAAQVGAPIKAGSKNAMMGAQLTYALQDLLTGLSMGNINQALLGMSNNLSMIAMLWGGVGASITSIAVAALPMLYTGMKAFLGQQDDAKEKEERLREAVERVNIAFERRLALFQHQAALRRAGEPIEPGEIKQAGEAQARIKDAEREIKQARADSDRAVQELKIIGEEKGTIGVNVTPPGGVEAKIKRGNAAAILAQRMKDVEHLQNAPIDKFDLFDRQKQIAHANEMLEKERKRIAMEAGFDDTHRAYLSAQGKIDIIRQRTADEIAAREKKESEWKKIAEDSAKSIAVNEAKLPELIKHRNELLRRDLGFMQRTANAGFNNYERAKIDLERRQAQERQELRDKGFGNVPLGPKMTLEERNKRIDEINAKTEEDVDANQRAMQEDRDKKLRHGRHLTDKEVQAYRDRENDIREAGKKAGEQVNKEFQEGPGTLLDPAMKALKTEQERERAMLAQRFANQGQGPGHFTGIEGLGKDFQSRIGDLSKSTDFARQTADNTKGINEAQRDLLTAVRELNLGFGP